MKKWHFIVAVLNIISGVYADTVTPERVAVSQIATAIDILRKQNANELSLDWAKISEFYNLDDANRSLVGRQSYPLQDHYEFVSKPVAVPGEVGSRVLVLRTVPLTNLDDPDIKERKQWRYMIYVREDGVILSTQISEEQAQLMLKNAGVVVTPKAGLPAVETDERLPGTELRPQPNPADVELLRQHPELDPMRKQAASASQSAPFPSTSVRPTENPSSPPTVEGRRSTVSFPIVPVAIIAIVIVGVIGLLLRRKN